MDRWMLQGMAFACLGVAALAAANKTLPGSSSASGSRGAGWHEARHESDRTNHPATKLPTKYRDRRQDVSLASQLTTGPKVTVGGQVYHPGPVKLGKAPDLGSAIERAGGVTDFAARNRVRLIREHLVTEYDVRNPEHRAVPLSDGDTVEVPQKNVIGR